MMHPSTRRLPGLVAAVVAVAGFVATAPLAAPAQAGVDDLQVIGRMPWGADMTKPRMHVDSVLHRGFVFFGSQVYVYDLASMRLTTKVNAPSTFNNNLLNNHAAVDEQHHRIFWLQNPAYPGGCSTAIWILRTDTLTWSQRPVPCYGPGGVQGFYVGGISYYPKANKLYVVGHSSEEFNTLQQYVRDRRQSAIYRQLDADTLALDWELDATSLCESFTMDGFGSGLAQRVGDHVISYCYQGGAQGGARGHSLVIDLVNGKPQGMASIRTSPTFAAIVRPRVDPVTGRILITAEHPPFGPAVWVFDPIRERFLGVVPTGIADPTVEGFQSGFDVEKGRLFFQSSRGFVTADVRHRPLPGGVSYPALSQKLLIEVYVEMAVDPGLRRMFVVDQTKDEFVVVADRSSEPADAPEPDYDQGTADIPEVEGTTARAYSAGANAYGIHLLNTSGIPAAVQGAVQGADCNPTTPGQCASSTALSPGNREYFLAQSLVELGSSSGATALASAGRTASNDRATDSDVRSLGHCQTTKAPGLSPEQQKALDDQCKTPAPLAAATAGTSLEGITFEKMRGGTAGGEYPIPSSLCSDFGERPTQASTDKPSPALGKSSVSCDATRAVVSSAAESQAPSFTDATGVTIHVAEASSDIDVELTAEGTRTTAWSEAKGLRLGDAIRIGRVRSEVVTVAHGRTGTTKATHARTISDVQAPGFSCAVECDPKDVASAINRAFAGKLRAFAAEPFKITSPKGYTALVAKDPEQRDSDRAVNDDDTVTVDGLTLVFYNDSFYHQQNVCGGGPFGLSTPCGKATGNRSRLVIGLAGVQAESHYGVFPLPDTGDPSVDVTDGPKLTELIESLEEAPVSDTNANLVIGTPIGRAAGSGMNPLLSAVTYPGRAAVDAVRLIVNHPGKAAVLFIFWLLLGAPVYFALRRRALATGLSS